MKSLNTPRSAFTVLDWIGWCMTVICVVGLVLFPIIGRTFARMFEDFGSASDLPLLTKLAVSFWFPPALAILAAVLLFFGLRTRLSLFQRRVLMLFAFVIVCGASAICLKGLYIPLFAAVESISS